MVGYLPPLLQSGGKINLLFQAIACELGEMEGGLTRLMRSRWYKLAQGFEKDASLADKATSDLGRLAALYGLEPGVDEETAYFRQRLASLVELHRGGLGTALVLLQLVSMVYRAEQPPEIRWERGKAMGLFTVPLPASGKETSGTRQIRVELEDNPPAPATARFQGIPADQRVLIINGGLDPAHPEISLTAPAHDDISLPILHHHDSGLDVLFLGRVPRGKTLTLRHQRVPLVDGHPEDTPVILAHPSLFNDEPQPVRFDSEEARFSVFNQDQGLPVLTPGENRWSYGTLSRKQLETYLAGRREPGLEKALKTALALAEEKGTPPPANLQLRWTESTPATFVLRIPIDYVPPHAKGRPDLLRELMGALNYGRAAGVQARIAFMLTLPPEVVPVDESPAHLELTTSFREPPGVTDTLASDALTSFGPAIAFEEQLPEPEDRLSWSGVFNTTRFDTSRFKK
jgi:hypothetical protein